MFKKILIPIDGSEQSVNGLKIACELAKSDKFIYLNILSIYKYHSFTERSLSMMIGGTQKADNLEDVLATNSREIVANAKKIAVESGIDKERVRGFVREGQTAKAILEFAKYNDTDLIVIGKQGKGDLSGYLLGGNSHKVSGLAKCPVLVV